MLSLLLSTNFLKLPQQEEIKKKFLRKWNKFLCVSEIFGKKYIASAYFENISLRYFIEEESFKNYHSG